jgi:segregation and condensation protein B
MVRPGLPNEPAEERIASWLESLLLVAGGPVSISALATVLGVSKRRVREVLAALQHERPGGVRVQLDGNSAQMVTAPENDEIVRRFIGTEKPAPLSRPALEALTIIAYRQPVTRAEIEAARGANSDRHVQLLLARGLIDERGQREVIGRPMQYGTTFAFLEYFGLGSLDDLPPLSDADAGELGQEEIGLRAIQEPLTRATDDE